MKNLLTFDEYIKEQVSAAPGAVGAGGGGVAYSTLNSNGMGRIVAPTVGSTPGSTWGSGSGNIGSGDIPAYDFKKSSLMINKQKSIKKIKRKVKKNNSNPNYFTKEYMKL